MWSVYLDPNPVNVAATRALGAISRRAYFGPLAPLRARQIKVPALPDARWVRVRNTVTGISSADVAAVLLRRDAPLAVNALPHQRRHYLGREVCGEVVEVGPEVQFLRRGDRVAYQLDQCCATLEIEPPCRHCATGNDSLCANRYSYASEQQAIGGGWGDEIVAHERQFFLVPDKLTDEQAALLEPSAAAVHAAMRHQPHNSCSRSKQL